MCGVCKVCIMYEACVHVSHFINVVGVTLRAASCLAASSPWSIAGPYGSTSAAERAGRGSLHPPSVPSDS